MPGPIKPALPAKWPPRPPRPAYAPKIPTIRTVSPVPGPTKSTRRRSFEVSRREPVVGYITRGSRGDVYVRALTYAARGRLRRASLGLYRGSAIVWGLLRGCDKLLKDAQNLRRPFYYIDRAYVLRGGSEITTSRFRVTLNRLQAGPIILRPSDRWEQLGLELAPWRTTGEEILVCPSSSAMRTFYGAEADQWLADTLATLAKHTSRPIVIRQKPAVRSAGELQRALSRAWAVVTFSSNIAVDAALAGVPVFTTAHSAAYPVASDDLTQIESPVMPDRLPWCHHLAYSQFTYAELGNGVAWRILHS
jgi:hypothetical protein